MNTQLLSAVLKSYQTTLDAMTEFNANSENAEMTLQMAEAMTTAINAGNKILVCGNGGSAAQAMHFAEELTGRYQKDRRALPALALMDPTHMSCVGNDYGFDKVFSRAIEAYAKPGDCLLLLSTSGNSANLITAVEAAKALSVSTFALLGKGGGKLKGVCDFEIIANGATSDCVQNIHMIIIHILIETIERSLFPENYA